MKSDLLYRLCKVIGDAGFARLRAYNDVYAKGSKQWRLIDYYRGLEVWSKEREKRDWVGENLAALKFKTLDWLFTVMARLGDWPDGEMMAMVGAIRWGIEAGAGTDLLDRVDEAKALAFETEEFGLALKIIELEQVILRDMARGPGKTARLKAALVQGEVLVGMVREVLDYQAFRVQHLEPLKDQGVASGAVRSEDFGVVLEALDAVDEGGLRTGMARLGYKNVRLFCQLVAKDYVAALKTADEMGVLYGMRPWLRMKDWGQYFQVLKNRVAAYVFGGQIDTAKGMLAAFEVGLEGEPGVGAQALFPRLWAYFYLAEVTGEEGLGREAMAVYRRDKGAVGRADEGKGKVWLYHFVSKTALGLGDFAEAVEALERLLGQKSVLSEAVLLHSRLMLVIAYLGQLREPEFIQNAAVACAMLFHRRKTAPPLLVKVLQWVQKIAKHGHGEAEQLHLLGAAIAAVEEEYAKDFASRAVFFPYHRGLKKVAEAIRGCRG